MFQGTFQFTISCLQRQVIGGPLPQAAPSLFGAGGCVDNNYREIRISSHQRGEHLECRDAVAGHEDGDIKAVSGDQGNASRHRGGMLDLKRLQTGNDPAVGKACGTGRIDNHDSWLAHGRPS
jgi:hypothetical protein